MREVNSLNHTRWECKYQCVAAMRSIGTGIDRERMRSCMRDGGLWPSEVCLQGPASNRPERHWLKTVVVSVREKS